MVPGALSLLVNWQGHKADHSPPTSAKVKKTWTNTSTPPYVFMVHGSSLVKIRDNFTFYLLCIEIGLHSLNPNNQDVEKVGVR
jgi:hypothetical protein